MDQDAVFVRLVISIAANVRTAVNQNHFLIELRRNAFGQRAAGKTRADDQPGSVHGTIVVALLY
jgi:hypothetical protein